MTATLPLVSVHSTLRKSRSNPAAQFGSQIGKLLPTRHQALQFIHVHIVLGSRSKRYAAIENRELVADRMGMTNIVGDEDDAQPRERTRLMYLRTIAVWRTPSAEVGSSRMSTFAPK